MASKCLLFPNLFATGMMYLSIKFIIHLFPLYKLLQTQYDLHVSKTIENLELYQPDEEIAKKLQIPVGSPCFSLDTHAYLEDGSIIEYSKTIFRGDLTHFIIERNYNRV
ncbi:UTRA domain-containing protein [Robertmurraya beringensis]|uniref:UTRA domain-containing protein n=1 Tax=Robertmurraya beringensis TaxID=641660 RepID=A0ABV6KYH7_9BACI